MLRVDQGGVLDRYASDNSLLPPAGRGTIRSIHYDGQSLWLAIEGEVIELRGDGSGNRWNSDNASWGPQHSVTALDGDGTSVYLAIGNGIHVIDEFGVASLVRGSIEASEIMVDPPYVWTKRNTVIGRLLHGRTGSGRGGISTGDGGIVRGPVGSVWKWGDRGVARYTRLVEAAEYDATWNGGLPGGPVHALTTEGPRLWVAVDEDGGPDTLAYRTPSPVSVQPHGPPAVPPCLALGPNGRLTFPSTLNTQLEWDAEDELKLAGTDRGCRGLVTREGEYWIADRFAGLCRDTGCVSDTPELPGNPIDLAEDGRGAMWAATTRGAVQRRGGRFFAYEVAGESADAVAVDREDRVWLATPAGVQLFNGAVFGAAGGLETPAHDLEVDAAGQLWAATDAGLLRRVGVDGFEIVPLHADGAQPAVHRVDSFPDGRLLVGSPDAGLFVVHPGGRVDHHTVADGLPSDEVRDLVVTEEDPPRAFILTLVGISEYVASP